jgi:hypothetical protein
MGTHGAASNILPTPGSNDLFVNSVMNPMHRIIAFAALPDCRAARTKRVRDLVRAGGLCATVVAGALACSASKIAGGPCGRNQQAVATVALPDTGISAGYQIQVAFIQHDPDLTEERSEVSIQHQWPVPADRDTVPSPRVRLLDEAGRVYIDTLGTRRGPAAWSVHHWIGDAATRNALYDAFATERLWLELWRAEAGLGTRVRLTTKEATVNPPIRCL